MLDETSNLLDYINDNESQLSNTISSLGSRANGRSSIDQQLELISSSEQRRSRHQTLGSNSASSLSKFRELISRDRHLLASFAASTGGDQQQVGRTILAPSDLAISKLRYDLRALVEGDTALIPSHWDQGYRQDLLDRLIKRHIIMDQALDCEQLAQMARSQTGATLISAKGEPVEFLTRRMGEDNDETTELLFASSARQSQSHDSAGSSNGLSSASAAAAAAEAQLVQCDLLASNGMLHVLDRVLGEQQESLFSLIESLVLRSQVKSDELGAGAGGDWMSELAQLIAAESAAVATTELNTAQEQQQQQQDLGAAQTNSIAAPEESRAVANAAAAAAQQQQHRQTGKIIGQFYEQMGESRRSLLAHSVNITHRLAQLASQAEGRQLDWTERFKLQSLPSTLRNTNNNNYHKQQQQQQIFTYFMPNDLAWLRLQRQHPQLHRPLMQLLSLGTDSSDQTSEQLIGSSSAQSQAPLKRQQQLKLKLMHASESSHRMLQVSFTLHACMGHA